METQFCSPNNAGFRGTLSNQELKKKEEKRRKQKKSISSSFQVQD